MAAAPIVFLPIYQKRVWGGREFAAKLGRVLPGDGQPYGESWEIVDRPEAQSVVAGGPWDGRALGDLWRNHRREIFGLADGPERFPILCKVLDARDKLSVQVHPPLAVCPQLQGEPKDELWYLLQVEPGAGLCVGLRHGVTWADFENALERGGMASLLHMLKPSAGQSIFLPSGRLHAIGAGFLLLEIQQNSDTTYRIYDWDRPGLDGKPRELHQKEAMLSVDFGDFEPTMRPEMDGELARCAHFFTTRETLPPGATLSPAPDGRFRIVAVARGAATCRGREFHPGDFFLLPAGGEPLQTSAGAVVLVSGMP